MALKTNSQTRSPSFVPVAVWIRACLCTMGGLPASDIFEPVWEVFMLAISHCPRDNCQKPSMTQTSWHHISDPGIHNQTSMLCSGNNTYLNWFLCNHSSTLGSMNRQKAWASWVANISKWFHYWNIPVLRGVCSSQASRLPVLPSSLYSKCNQRWK